jgi:hypothetical protein
LLAGVIAISYPPINLSSSPPHDKVGREEGRGGRDDAPAAATVCCYRSLYFFVMASFTKLKASSGLLLATLLDSKNEKPLAGAEVRRREGEGGGGGIYKLQG